MDEPSRNEPRLGGSELDCEGEPVQAADDLGDDRRICFRRRPPGGLRTRREEAHGVGSGDHVGFALTLLREAHGRNAEEVLARDVEPRPARREDAQSGSCGEQLGHERPRVEHVLDVVEHEQDLLRADLDSQPLEERLPGLTGDAERLRDGTGDVLGPGDRCERDEGDAVRVLLRDAARCLDGEPGLADASGPHEGHEADLALPEQPDDLVRLRPPPDEPLRDEQGEILREELGELLGGLEVPVGDVVGCDSPEQLLQALLAFPGGLLHVDELRLRPGEEVLVLEAGDLHSRSDPAVLLPVDADEDVALLEVGAVERPGWMRPGAEIEEHRSEAEPFDGRTRGSPLRRELPERRGDEDPDPPIRGQDR